MTTRAQKVLIAANPRSGAVDRRALVQQLSERLQRSGFQTEVLYDRALWSERVNYWKEQGELRAVIAAGGDGTVASVVNAIPADVPLLVFPLGTENLLARHFGLKADIEFAVRTIERDKRSRIDAGSANGKLFLVMFSCGFDSTVVKYMDQMRTGHIRYWSWFGPIWKGIRTYRYPELRMKLQGEGTTTATIHETAKWLFVFNLPRYAAALPIVHDAIGDDGLLDYCAFRHGSFWSGIHYLLRIITHTHRKLSDSILGRCISARVECDEAIPFQIDGDVGGELPVDISMIPQRVELLLP